LSALESKLVAYVRDADAASQPFDVCSVPKVSREQAAQEVTRPSSLDTIVAPVTRTATPAAPQPQTAEETRSSFAQQLAQVPELASYGAVINSSKPAQLTENETEYQVSCVKHIFREHIVFQFNVSNTMPDTILEQVSVIMQLPVDSGLTENFIIPVPALSSAKSPGVVYVSFTREAPDEYATASFPCVLKFISKEVDPATGEPEAEGYEDEYQLEEVELAAGGDYIIPSYLNFSSEWDRLRTGASITETFTLSSMESIKAACDSIVEILNMEPLGGSQNPAPGTTVHTLQLSGLLTGGGGKILARCRMTFSRGEGVTLELGVRGEKQEACQLVIAAIGG